MAVSLAELCRGVPGEPFGDWANATVGGISLDSRRVAPGDLFAALPGRHTDGAAYVPEALARGAQALLLPAGTPPPPGVPGLTTAVPRRTLSQLAARFFGNPSERVRVFGVTGSNGKTTVVAMLAQILAAAGRPGGLWSTDRVDSGLRRFRPALTTPEAPDLQRFLHEVESAGMGDACIEVSSHGVVQDRVADVTFTAGAITSVTPDHLDFHQTYDAYLEAKRGFLRALAPSCVLAYNLDDPGAVRASAGMLARRISCGFGVDADIRATQVESRAAGARCTVQISPWLAQLSPAFSSAPARADIAVPLPGRHNLTNAMLAMALALATNVPLPRIQEALADFSPPARRLRIERIGRRLVLDDVAMNQASFDAVFSTIAGLELPQLVVVVALRGNRGPEVNADIAARLVHWNRKLAFAPLIVTLSRRALSHYPLDYQVRPAELTAFLTVLRDAGLPHHLHTELDAAVADAAKGLREDGAMLLLGTFGMDGGLALAARLLGAEQEGPTYSPPSFD